MKALTKTIGLLILFALVSCEKDLGTYEGDEFIQFGPEPERIYSSGARLEGRNKTQTFFYEHQDIVYDTVYFDIYAIGGISSFDRSFSLVQEEVDGATNAVPDVHYVSFDDMADRYVIKANTTHTAVPVVVKRHQDLRNESYTLKFSVVANEHFDTGESDLLWRTLAFSDRIERPNLWTGSFESFWFGKFSLAKITFMIQVTGLRWDDETISEVQANFAYQQFLKTKVVTALIEYNSNNPALIDEDGEPVVFP